MNLPTVSTALMVLMVAACTGGTEASTTTLGGTTTSSITTTTSTSMTTGETTTTEGTGTTGGTDTTDPGPPPTLPAVIAQTAFAFAAGTTPRIAVTVEVGESPDGPWLPAGFGADTPTLTGSSFWARFTIANLDSLGSVTDVDISGFDNSVLGEDVCSLEAPIPVGGEATCIVGGSEGFPVVAGGEQNDFTAVGEGERQGVALERYIDPPLPPGLEFADAQHSFILLFDTGAGVGIEGTADGPEVEVDIAGLSLSGPVRVDCSDRYPGGRSSTGGSPTGNEPALVAYVIENFSSGGESLGGCSEIPTVGLTFDLDGSSDTAFLYTTP